MENRHWVVIIIILVVGYLILNNVSITISTHEIDDSCNTNETYSVTPLDGTFDNSNYHSPIPLDCWIKCKSTGRFELTCDGGVPICNCKATLMERFFN